MRGHTPLEEEFEADFSVFLKADAGRLMQSRFNITKQQSSVRLYYCNMPASFEFKNGEFNRFGESITQLKLYATSPKDATGDFMDVLQQEAF